MVKVIKSFAILTISKLLLWLRWKNCKPCLFWLKIFWSFVYFSPENFLIPPVENIFEKHFYDLVKTLGKVGQNMTPPPPHVDAFTTSLIEISDHCHWIGNVLKWSSLTGSDIRDLGFTICTTKNINYYILKITSSIANNLNVNKQNVV